MFMDGLYDSIGKIASAAHANSDDIDGNALPSDPNNEKHGLDIFHNGHYYRFRAMPNEPKFTVESPISFAPRLRDQYSKGQIQNRVDTDFASLSGDEQESVVDGVLQSDLETATEHEEEFQARLQDEVTPISARILRLSYGEEELWNGVIVRDYIFPQRDSFDIVEYRDIVEEIRYTKVSIGEIMYEVIPPLRNDYAEESVRPEPNSSLPDSVAFY